MMKILFFLLIIGTSVNAQGLVDYETFNINTERDTILTTKLGSQVNIPKAAFQDLSGNDLTEGTIEISIKEVTNQEDMVLEGLSTNTKEGILISNGMISIEAASNGQKIELAKNKTIGVKIPAQKGKSDMRVYSFDNQLKNWAKSDIAIQLDTCSGYRLTIITREKTVTKNAYKKWKKEQKLKKKEKVEGIERLFGGRVIDLRLGAMAKSYSIPIPIDTVWTCKSLDISQYSFNIQALGWYNIDKLIIIQDPVNLVVTTTEDLDVFLLLRNENICVRGLKTGSTTYEFKKVPGETFATIVAYRQNDAENINVSVQNLYLKSSTIELNPTKEITVGEFRRVIKMMGLK